MIKLSQRLQKISEFALPQLPIADIGSDHAYLPIYLIQKSIIPAAIVGEVAAGPFKNAQETVKTTQLNDKVSIRLGDGLAVLNEDDIIGTIFICGMGGILIKDILNEGKILNKLPREARLVLQPNNNEPVLREYLQENHYEIVEEAILEDNNKMYEIIVAEASAEKMNYTAEEFLFGPKLMSQQTIIFKKKWQNILNKNHDILNAIKGTNISEDIQKMKETTKLIEKVIK